MSASAVPATNCELACTESCERVSSLTPVGEDILLALVYNTAKIPCKTDSKLQASTLDLLVVQPCIIPCVPCKPIPNTTITSLVVFNLPSASKRLVSAYCLVFSAQSLTPAAFGIFLILPRSLSSNARHSFASFASLTQFVLPSWETSGMAPKPPCEVVEVQICSLVLQPPRLIFALKIRSDVQTSQQHWRRPEQSHQNQPRGDGKTKSASTHLQQSCRRKISLRKNVTD